MTPDTRQPEDSPGLPADDPRYAPESGEPIPEGRHPGRPDAERDVERPGADPDHRKHAGQPDQDWESGRQDAL
jgi:hypothetical protein